MKKIQKFWFLLVLLAGLSLSNAFAAQESACASLARSQWMGLVFLVPQSQQGQKVAAMPLAISVKFYTLQKLWTDNDDQNVYQFTGVKLNERGADGNGSTCVDSVKTGTIQQAFQLMQLSLLDNSITFSPPAGNHPETFNVPPYGIVWTFDGGQTYYTNPTSVNLYRIANQ